MGSMRWVRAREQDTARHRSGATLRTKAVSRASTVTAGAPNKGTGPACTEPWAGLARALLAGSPFVHGSTSRPEAMGFGTLRRQRQVRQRQHVGMETQPAERSPERELGASRGVVPDVAAIAQDARDSYVVVLPQVLAEFKGAAMACGTIYTLTHGAEKLGILNIKQTVGTHRCGFPAHRVQIAVRALFQKCRLNCRWCQSSQPSAL